jgi:peptide/nickel transport system permease protein
VEASNVERQAPSEQVSHRRLRYAVRVILRDPLALFSLLIIAILIVLALFGPWLAPYPRQGEGKTNVPDRFLPPSEKYWLGADQLGRDILSRVIVGSRIALQAPAIVVILAVLIGAPLGALAGYLGGWVDNLIMRVTDLFLAFPSLLLAVTIVAAVGPSLTNAMIAIAISWWPWYTRLVRGVTISLRERYFVEAARSIGVPSSVIILPSYYEGFGLSVMHALARNMYAETSPTVAVHLDGDPFGNTPATIGIEPGKLRLLIPPQAPSGLFSKPPELVLR